MVRHRHRVFGLNVDSCLPLPAPVPGKDAGSTDLEIVAGPVPVALSDARSHGVRFQVGAGRALITVDGVARFLVEEGRRITIARDAAADDDDVRTFLMGSAFGALLHQRDELALRGSAIAVGGAGVLLLGETGAGKSTLATALEKHGATVLCDDLCLVRLAADGGTQVHAGFLDRKLWPDALAQLGVPADGLPRARRGLEKRIIRTERAGEAQAVRVRKIYVLRAHAGGEVTFAPVEGVRKVSILNQQTYRPEFVAGLDGDSVRGGRLMQLAQHTSLTVVDRPQEPWRLDALVARCLEDLRS